MPVVEMFDVSMQLCGNAMDCLLPNEGHVVFELVQKEINGCFGFLDISLHYVEQESLNGSSLSIFFC